MKDRLYQLLLKTLAFKSLVGIVLPTVLLCLEKIDQTAWWIAVAAVLFARAYEKTNNKNGVDK